MVWGISTPRGSGEFWAYGDYEGEGNRDSGWRERLRTFYSEQTPEVKKTLFDYDETGFGSAAHFYPGYVSDKFTREIGSKSGPDLPHTIPIKDHEPPRFFQTIKGHASLGSLLYGPYATDEALKTIIERLEPGVHQFYPIEIRMPRNKSYPAQYYTFVIGQYLDSFSRENSKKGSCRSHGPKFPDSYFYENSSKGISGLALSKADFGGAHLWVERRLTGRLVCISDKLQTEIASAGLKIPKHYRMIEV